MSLATDISTVVVKSMTSVRTPKKISTNSAPYAITLTNIYTAGANYFLAGIRVIPQSFTIVQHIKYHVQSVGIGTNIYPVAPFSNIIVGIGKIRQITQSFTNIGAKPIVKYLNNFWS